jgi:hypothetical protein
MIASRYIGLKIGFWFAGKSLEKLWFKEMIEEANSLGVTFIEFDFFGGVLPNIAIDALYWKCSLFAPDSFNALSDRDHLRTLELFRSFVCVHPSIYYLGPPSNGCTQNRTAMKRLWDALDLSVAHPIHGTVVVRQPVWTSIAPTSALLASDFRYPLVAKPIAASSHSIALIYNFLGLAEYQQAMKENGDDASFTLEEFHNHSGVIYKLYALGDNYWIFSRPSFPNIDLTRLPFDKNGSVVNYEIPSVRVSRGKGKEQSDGKVGISTTHSNSKSEDSNFPSRSSSSQPCNSPPSLLPDSAARALMAYVRQHAQGLDVFGVDLIRCDATAVFYVIDINFAPSYAEVPSGQSMLLHHILDETLKLKEKMPK